MHERPKRKILTGGKKSYLKSYSFPGHFETRLYQNRILIHLSEFFISLDVNPLYCRQIAGTLTKEEAQ
ncbi:hypothetical protein D6C13_24910 [Rahnella woolbedingensis]|uniref:Uncharacterized protein n=1 Tax=Rahnella woolbedingensis TaxID=1510574 RepID=A0A419N1Z1_9GAMM|nr:hypothetical protein D6C13_24910 [Rahnella woolbedingensis]